MAVGIELSLKPRAKGAGIQDALPREFRFCFFVSLKGLFRSLRSEAHVGQGLGFRSKLPPLSARIVLLTNFSTHTGSAQRLAARTFH